MEVAPLRLEPPAYGATIGPAGGGRGARLAAVLAALVSLLAVGCAVVSSGGSRAQASPGLPGFELSLKSAMEVFFKNTARRERAEAAAQQAEVQRLASVPPATQHLAAADNAAITAVLPSGAAEVKFRKVPSDSAFGSPVTASDEGYGAFSTSRDSSLKEGASSLIGAAKHLASSIFGSGHSQSNGVVEFHIHQVFQPNKDIGVTEHYSGSYLHKKDEPKPFAPGVVSGATASTIANMESDADAMQRMLQPVAPEEKDTKKTAAQYKARTQGLANARTTTHGLDNKPWRIPASDFPARKPVQQGLASKPKAFDVPVPKGLKSGQAFLVEVPGHREREVTVPAGVRPGQLVSIDVAQATHVTKSKLEGEEPAAEAGEEAEAGEAAEAAGAAATVEAAEDKMNDATTVPVVFGENPEEQAAGEAVNAVHDMFRKEESVSKKWVPGDTQPIPRLEPLGQTSQDKWTSAVEVYGDQTSLHMQSCAARCDECKTMGAGNWYCQKCGDVCNQLSQAASQLKPYAWKVGAPRGAIDPMAQAELAPRYFKAIKSEEKGDYMKQPMLPTKKRWYQKTTQITHFSPGGVSQITANPKWPVQATAGLSSLANLYKPDQVPSNLPTLSSLATVEGREYKRSLEKEKAHQQLLQLKHAMQQRQKTQRTQALDEEEGEGATEPEAEAAGEQGEGEGEGKGEGEVEGEGEGEGEGAVPEKVPGFVVATPDDQGPATARPARQTTNVNVIGPGGPSFVQIHTVPAENPQHFGAYAKPNFRSEYPTTQTITVNPTRPVVRMVSSAAAPQMVSPQPVLAAPSPATSVVTSYLPAAMAAKQQTIKSTLGSGGLMFQVPVAPGIALAPSSTFSQTTTVNQGPPAWGKPSVASTTVTSATSNPYAQYVQSTTGAPVQYVQAPRPTVQTVQTMPAQYVQTTTGGGSTDSSSVRVMAGAAPVVQVVHTETRPNYQSLTPIPQLQPMSFFDKKKRAKKALFRHWDGKEMQVLNVLPESSDGEINLDPQNWQGQNMVISEGSKGAKADQKFSEAMAQVTEGLHAAANSELHFKGGDRTSVGYREYGDVNPAIGEPADPTRGGPKLISGDPFGLRPKEASSPVQSINDRAGAVPTGSRTEAMESMVVKVPAGLKAGQQFTALTGDGHTEDVTVPAGVKAGADVEITIPKAMT